MKSAYQLMWMMVMFDLPVQTKRERKRATRFRKSLLDMGFEMSQFSVYLRFCGSKERTQKYVKELKKIVPKYGNVSILFFTDKQFGQIINITGGISKKAEQSQQLTLF